MKDRHPQIRNVQDLDPVDQSHGERFASRRKRLGAAAGGKQIGCSWYEIPAGKSAFPHHAHYVNEEAFYVLEGQGELRLGDQKFEIIAGDYVACPAGPDSAHSIRNTGTGPLRYLGLSTGHAADIITYPDSQKVAMAAQADVQKGLKASKFYRMFRDQPSVDYYEGED